ncbi:MAG: DUF2520 domain-containing protein [Candidatus Marinimicrobia bacterium]|nr:DUF2520 domain-containing protein [Candidatus Neomarinimicrobiota bacterium]
MTRACQTFSVFGASRIGISFAYHLQKNSLFPQFLWNRSPERLKQSDKWVRFETVTTQIDEFDKPTDWLIISVSDDAIETIVQNLAKLPVDFNGCLAFHTSGFLSSEILTPLKERGCRIGSCHPVLSAPDVATGIQRFSTGIFACEGEIETELIHLTSKIGKIGLSLTPEQKQMVHVSAVFLNNYSVSLIAAVKNLCRGKGLSDEYSMLLLKGFSEQSVESGWQRPLLEALTGPASRGDRKTIEKHLEFLESDQDLKTLYEIFLKITQNLLLVEKSKKSENRNGVK